MQSIQTTLDFVLKFEKFVKTQSRYLNKLLEKGDIQSPRAECAEKCLGGLRLITDEIESLHHSELNDDWEQLVSALSGLYDQLAIFQKLLEEATDYDNKRPELAERRRQAIQLYQKTAEQQQQELALKVAETQLKAEQERARVAELSLQEEDLKQKNISQKYTLEDLTAIFVTRLTDITPERVAADQQKQFLEGLQFF